MNSNKNNIDILDKITVEGEYNNKIKIDELGRIEIIDDILLAEIRGGDLGISDLNTSYLNFSCNGNSSCC